MIAPLRPVDVQRSENRGRMRRAKRLVASLLVREAPPSPAGPPRIATWRAWLFAAWVVVVVAVYAARMFGVVR